jgi:hypothetical protein
MIDPNDPHPWYGPCDGFGQDGLCSECAKIAFDTEPAFLTWLRQGGYDARAAKLRQKVEAAFAAGGLLKLEQARAVIHLIVEACLEGHPQ